MIEYYTKNIASREDLQITQKFFEDLDIDGDGFLNFEEIKDALGNRKKSKKDAIEIFKLFRKKVSELITFPEFNLAMIDLGKLQREPIIKKMFYNLDKTKEGVIFCSEFIKTSDACGEETQEMMFKRDFRNNSAGKLTVRFTRCLSLSLMK